LYVNKKFNYDVEVIENSTQRSGLAAVLEFYNVQPGTAAD
jgi:hypothetical protein